VWADSTAVHVRVEQMMDCGDSMSSSSFEEVQKAQQSLGIAKMTQAERPRDAGSFRSRNCATRSLPIGAPTRP
jgi:hypothetical protein